MKATCSITDCSGVVIARGWCRRHYNRWHLHGDPLGGGVDKPRKATTVPRGSTPETRFWAKVRKTDTCWLWTAAVNEKGYGLFWVAGRCWKAHRYAWHLAGREFTPGLDFDHTCNQPSCVRLDHFEEVTSGENNLRRSARNGGQRRRVA